MSDIHEIRGGYPLLSDIPGQLRRLADDIEAGKIQTDYVIAVLENGELQTFGWGNVPETLSIIGLLDVARHWFIEQRAALQSTEEKSDG